MPSNPSGTGYRLDPMPFFVSDGNGGMRLDSAGSLAHVNPQKRLLEQGRPRPMPEHVVNADRQKKVDAYVDAFGAEGLYYQPHEGKTYMLPTLASPQQIHTELYGAPRHSIEAKRSAQLEGLDGSVVGNFLKKALYSDIDKAFEVIKERKEHLIGLKKEKRNLFSKFSHKRMEFAQEDKDWIYQPLQDSVNRFNNFAIERSVPMKFVWRQTWESESTQRVDLWVIYPNTPEVAAKGPRFWMGANDIVDPRA